MSPRSEDAESDSADSYPSGAKLWTMSFVMGMIVQLGASLVFVTLMTYMAMYAMQSFAVQEAAAGFAASSFILGSLLTRIPAGKYTDFLGRKRLIVGALAVFTACSALYPVVVSYPGLISLRLVHGSAFGAISTALMSSVVGMVPDRRRGEGLGYFLTVSTLAMALGPLLAIRVTGAFGPDTVFLLTGFASAIALAAALFARFPERKPDAQEYAHRFRVRPADALDPQVLPVSLVVLLCAFGYTCVITYVAPFLQQQDLTDAASLFFLVLAAGMLVARLISGRLQDRRGDNSVIVPSVILFAASLGVLGMTTEIWHVVCAGIFAGLGYGGLLPSLQVAAVERVHPNRIGIGVSTHYLMLDTGVAVGPLLFGFLIPLAGYRGLYLCLAGIGMAAVILYWFVHGKGQTATHYA